MTNFLVMQQRIADEIVRDDLASQIQKAINSAIGTWEGIRFGFNERRYLLQTVADQEYYATTEPTITLHDSSALDTGEHIIEIDVITCTVNNMQYPLTPRTQMWFEQFTAPASVYTGQPDSYGWYGDELRLYPIPDGVYPIGISALGSLGPQPLSGDTDTNDWLTKAEALIRHQAKYLIYRDLVRDAEGKATAAEGIQEAQWQLERKAAGKTHTGRQAAWSL